MEQKLEQYFLRSLGAFVVEASCLEAALADLYWLISNFKDAKVIKNLRNLTMGGLIKATGEMFTSRIADETLRAMHASLAERLATANHKRNEYVHAFWSARPEKAWRRDRPRTGPLELHTTLTPGEIDDESKKLADLAESVWALYDEIRRIKPPGIERAVELHS